VGERNRNQTQRPKRFIEDNVRPKFNRRSVSLTKGFPEIAAEWYYKKNAGWGPDDFACGSHVTAWFKCSTCSHLWQAEIKSRTLLGSGCPSCNTYPTTDLRDYPDAYRDFDRSRNKDVDPHQLTRKAKVWWRCSAAPDHKWFGYFSLKASQRCPFCLGVRGSSTNSLKQVPKLAREFDTTKNGLKPKDVPLGSRTHYWWKCKKGPDHQWQTTVADRNYYNTDCPYCKNKKVSVTNSLASLYPKLLKDWHPTKNSGINPEELVAGSHKQIWWLCHVCKNEWQTRLESRTTRGQGCKKCAIRKRYGKETPQPN
jgi:hypothetical protein